MTFSIQFAKRVWHKYVNRFRQTKVAFISNKATLSVNKTNSPSCISTFTEHFCSREIVFCLHFQRHEVRLSQYGSATDLMNIEASRSWNKFEKIHLKALRLTIYAEAFAETPERCASEQRIFIVTLMRERERERGLGSWILINSMT